MPELRWSHSKDADPGSLQSQPSRDKAASPASPDSLGLADRTAGRAPDETTDQISPEAPQKQRIPHEAQQDDTASSADEGSGSDSTEHDASHSVSSTADAPAPASAGRQPEGSTAQAAEPKRKRRHYFFGKPKDKGQSRQQRREQRKEHPSDNLLLAREIKGLAHTLKDAVTLKPSKRRRRTKGAEAARQVSPHSFCSSCS